VDHKKDADVLLIFFRLALSDFEELAWEYRRLPIPVDCVQTDSISCGLFTCMNTKAIVEQPEILLGGRGRKRLQKSQVSQEKAAWWRFYLFYIIVMKSK
jgi:hypothetical protein